MKYDVVIVDTGFNGSHLKLKDKRITGVQIIKRKKGVYNVIDLTQDNDDVGHGTAITSIIFSHMANVNVFMIKIFNSSLYVDEELLFYSLKYIYEKIDCRLVNLSLGIPVLKHYKRMYDICEKLKKKGVSLIAAFDNDGSISFPAAFDNVIGVTNNSNCHRSDDYYVIDNPIVNVGAKGGLQRIAWSDSANSLGQGNSYACAHISGISIKLIKEEDICSSNLLLKTLKQHQTSIDNNTDKKYRATDLSNNSFPFRKAVVFPFNKEIHALIRFQHLLPFKIVDVYDIKYSCNIGAFTNQLLNNERKDTVSYRIKRIDDLDWDSFDTLIIGHTKELMNGIIKNTSFVDNLLHQAYERNKYVFSFDNLPDSYQNNKSFICPDTFKNYTPVPYGKLFRHAKPVLAVFGTSSKQGKFTLQLLVREKFLEKGYKVGQLGTEPSSLLFKMDECFHFGYDSEIKLSRFSAISFLNNAMYNISRKNVDIIITGCQSESIMVEEGNLFNYPLPQIEFLFGILPDAIVLVVNPWDDIEIIKRTIAFLESCVDCKVIAVVVFPMTRNKTHPFGAEEHISDLEFDHFRAIIEEKCNVSVFQLDKNNHIEGLIELIIHFFSQ